METIDLNIENYTLHDLYNLFHISNNVLTEETMKQAKKMVLKTHPDKSKLEPKYFLFFSNAYKKLFAIYEFQNKSIHKKADTNDYDYKEGNKVLLDNVFKKNNKLKDADQFNKWFNQEFEKHKVIGQDDLDNGYGDWIKSEQDMYTTNIASQSDMHVEFEKQKKKIQAISVYNGISDPFSSTLGGSLLGQNNNFSSGLFDQGLNYQDLKQAHLETIIPITQEDYQNVPKFNSFQEYKTHRETQDIRPLKEEEALQKIRYNDKTMEEESANLAFYYAKQSEDALKKHSLFWSNLQRIQNTK